MFRCPATGTVQSNRQDLCQDDNSQLPELKKEAEETSFHEVSCATGDIREVDHVIWVQGLLNERLLHFILLNQFSNNFYYFKHVPR